MVDLEKISSGYASARKAIKRRVIVCAGTGCIANGSEIVTKQFLEEHKKRNIKIDVSLKAENNSPETLISGSGCQGFCQMGPLVTIEQEGSDQDILYVQVRPEDVEEIVENTIVKGEVVERLLYKEPGSGKVCVGQAEIPFYSRQNRIVLAACGASDPLEIGEYINNDGYQAARKAFTQMSQEEICKVISDSGLRGRGGGGFPTGRKWDLARKQEGKTYIICNGDEGDPGAFMDRSILEGNPHSVIEGMMIGAKAFGSDEGYIYVRTEYPLAVSRMRKAIEDAEAAGILGNDIFGSGQSLKLHVMEGAGAFVCGEASAMVASIMGNRGMPRVKPPRTAEKGLWEKPTVVNNVETLATVPLILRKGVAEYRKRGTESSPGTKTFALTGHVANTGLIEVPFGATLRQIIFDIGGGVLDSSGKIDNSRFKAVQIGGPSGGCLTEEHLDIPLDFDSLGKVGAMIGSGGLVVMNDSTCMVQIAKFFMQFTQEESCGKCVPCREGTRQMLELLTDITEGKGSLETIDLLGKLGKTVTKASLCGLGKSAASPVLSTIKMFEQEYLAHVEKQVCPTRECSALTPITIIPELCKGCTLCAKKCPVGAISGERKEAHVIDAETCIKCGVCVDACKFNAIEGGAA